MIKSKHFKRFIRIIASFLIVSIVLTVASALCNHPNDLVEETVTSFYNEVPDTLDYVVLGSSAAQAAVFPVVVYDEGGITGNNMCVDGCNSRLYLSILKEIIPYQKNALIIVDMDGFTYIKENKEYNSPSFWIDSMKKGENWWDTINRVDKDNLIEHCVPILKYHKNFLDCYTKVKYSKDILFSKSTLPMKGANYLNEKRLPDEQMNKLTPFDISSTQPKAVPSDREELLREFLAYCKENKVENVLFCDFPKAYFDDNRLSGISEYESRSLYCKDIINEYGFDYLNFNDKSLDLNLNKDDFADSFHVNCYGAVKLSKCLTNYLSKNYEFDTKDEAVIADWDENKNKVFQEYQLG